MEKLLLIDGNSMLFRAYYATIYGQSMSSASGIPTNAIYGFALMLQKAISTIEPKYIVVAFDHSKETYRHKEYPGYKGTRSATPDDLKVQFPIIREYLDALHIVHYEQAGLEADDIIGCLAKNNSQYDVSVLTSDKDLLQLVDGNINVYLMHKGISEIALMDRDAIKERFDIEPIQIIDLKGLAGDSSDNIPGVSGVGDKTAAKLINQYGSVEGVYENIGQIGGKLQEKLLNDKDNAYLSKHLATIITDQTIDLQIESCLYQKPSNDAYQFYRKYDMKSLASKVEIVNEKKEQFIPRSCTHSDYLDYDLLNDETLLFLGENELFVINDKLAHSYDMDSIFADANLLDYLASDKTKIFYDIKKWYHLSFEKQFEINGQNFDLMITSFLCDSKIKNVNDLLSKYELLKQNDENQQLDLFAANDYQYKHDSYVAGCLYHLWPIIKKELSQKEMDALYYNIELPLAKVLANMEINGVCVNESILDEIAQDTSNKMNGLEQEIYVLANKQFNINSPKQLAEIIYDDLQLTRSPKRSTDVKVLSKLADVHPIINKILEYRKYAKIYSTYANGLKKYISTDNKIHTVYNQCVTETGRLSSSEPNLQNISIRSEEASVVRKAFLPSKGCVLVGADYSQVELRMLAHLANEENLIQAFKDGMDIHTKTAMDIFGVSKEEVTPLMRRQAKAINFGIDYGMSAFGLSEQLQIPVGMANDFINAYFTKYPNVKKYMNDLITTCQTSGYVTTMFNRRREIPEINASNYNLKQFGQRAAMNAPVQGSAADLIKIAMINVYNKLNQQGLKAKLILQIHDELILDVPIEEKDKVMELVSYEMEHALALKVPLVAQATWGNDWLEVK